MNRRMLLLLAGLVLSAGLLWLDGGGAEDDLALPAGGALKRVAVSATRPVDEGRSASMNEGAGTAKASVPVLRSRATPERGAKRSHDLFAPRSWAAAPAPAAVPAAAPVAVASSAVKAVPELPFVYIGRQRAAGVDQVFLAENEIVHVVQHDSVIRGLYKVQQIAPAYVQLLYLPLNHSYRLQTGSLD